MFRELLKAWRTCDPVCHMLHLLDGMLADTRWMFEEACAVLGGEKPAADVRDRLFERDQRVNRVEREVRRKIRDYLATGADANIPGCLALISTVKDAERIGDYCKNVFELAEVYGRPLEEGRYSAPLLGIRKEILAFFEMTRQAYADGDDALAREVVHRKATVSKETDLLIDQLVRDNLDTAYAVAYALLARHFKRISSHLANIASSVFAPLDAIDYSDEPGWKHADDPE